MEEVNSDPKQPLLLPIPPGSVKEAWGELKKLWQIAAPSIFCRLAMFSLTIITQSLAGHLGQNQLAAISIVTTVIISITFGFLLGMASVLEMLCGQAYGGKQYRLLGIYLQRSWVVLFLSSIALLPLFIFLEPMLKLVGQPAPLAELAGQVALWLIPMHLSFAFQFTLTRFLQCQLKTCVVAWVCGAVLALHVVISWIFVYNLRVGIVGIALTLDFSWWMSVVGMFIYSVCGWCPTSWTGFSREAFNDLWDFFKLSLASGVMLALENFYFRMLVLVSSIKGTEVAVDALSICMSFYGWESMIPMGLYAATGIRVACEIGAGNENSAKLAAKVSVFNSLLIGFLFFGIIMAFPDKIAMIFVSSSSVISMVEELASLLAITILFNCIQPILSGVAVGSGWQVFVAYINIGSYYIVGVPLGIFLGWYLHFGVEGIWVGMICGTIVQTLILSTVTVRRPWGKTAKALRFNSSVSEIN
ncbi:protein DETOXIFICATION 27-like isoform X1 [Salvia splendens]|uniref:protein DETOXIFICATION 27-like isoform X1 n=1 Tax=Salvia splendens TaxID=180675 RepID=UPI001C26F401|nr:protein DETOXIFICATION 27-like isoform X1 [Salvia splendens]